MNLPKVLIIGQPFNNATGGGITLSNLFKNWSKDELAVACSGYLLADNIDANACNTYYQLGYKETKWRFPFNLIQSKYFSGPLKFEDKRFQNFTAKKSKLRVKLIMSFFVPVLEFLGLSHIISKTTLSNQFRAWIKDFNPDVIYVQPTSRDGILFCLSVHNFLKRPLILHVMDDWPALISDKGIFKKFWSKKLDIEFRNLLEKADVLMSISESMSEEYKTRYNKNFIPFNNPINIKFWKEFQRNNYSLSDNPKILYAGRIGLGIETSLELLAKAIQKINENFHLSIEFILCTESNPAWADNYSCVRFKGYIPYNLIPKTFSEADFLFLPYDFSKESIKYIQYSMPTKGPEYMMSGTPIILFAPKVTAIVKYCQKYDCAKIITDCNVESLSKSFIDLIKNEVERNRIAQNAKKIAEEKHSSINVTNDFEKIIKSLVVR